MRLYFPCVFLSLLVCNISVANEMEPSPKDYNPNLIVNRNIQLAVGTIPRKAKWQGLYCNENICELKNIKIQINKNFVDYLYEEKVPLDKIEVPGDPIAIFPNTDFKIGKLPLFYKSTIKVNASDETQIQNNKLKDGIWNMSWENPSFTLLRTELNKDSFNYILSDGKKSQSLFEIPKESIHGSDTTPIIHWIGDLDRDGKLDIILEIPDDNCKFDYRLFLSSKATKNEILKEYLRFTGTEEACGC